jgi:SHS2 domain-containing protein
MLKALKVFTLMMNFEEIEHTADKAFRARGRTLAELLENAARAMASLDKVAAAGKSFVTRDVALEGADRETLLVNWLNEILYLEQTHREVYDRFRISQINDNHLRARLYGRPSANRVSHIKAATFHDLGIKQTPEGFEATVVLDV